VVCIAQSQLGPVATPLKTQQNHNPGELHIGQDAGLVFHAVGRGPVICALDGFVPVAQSATLTG
jgi:hypothetical protein